MKKKKLNYIFHNPNTVEETADYILKVFIEVNEHKVEQAIHEAVDKLSEATMTKNSDAVNGMGLPTDFSKNTE